MKRYLGFGSGENGASAQGSRRTKNIEEKVHELEIQVAVLELEVRIQKEKRVAAQKYWMIFAPIIGVVIGSFAVLVALR